MRAARDAGLLPGAFLAGLVAGVPALASGASRTDRLAALIASSAELSTLSRNIHHLTRLLRQGEVRAALEYREMLDTLGGDVRGAPAAGRERAGRAAAARAGSDARRSDARPA